MSNYLISTVETWRVPTLEDVKNLQEEVNNSNKYVSKI